MLGWLLTPLVAWAASFVGAMIGSAVSAGFDDPMNTFWFTAVSGLITALLAASLWLRLLGRSRTLQRTLEVSPEGVPLAAIEADQPKAPS